MTRNVFACYGGEGSKPSGNTPTLQLTPLPEKRRPKKAQKPPSWIWLLVRVMMWAVTTVLAVAIPQFDKLLGFAGSLFSFTTCLTFPCACFLKLLWDKIGPVEKGFNLGLIGVGVVCAIAGALATVFVTPT
jgi:amino acid permease